VHLPERFIKAVGSNPIWAYRESLADARRSCITEEELCSLRWSSRMKGWAGETWTDDDPWWQGRPPREKKYNSDGTTESFVDGVLSGRPGRWKFVQFASGGREMPLGSLVRISRGGREFPTHYVSRYPPNWGWIVQNCWGISASFPLPPQGACPELEDDGPYAQAVTCETEREEAFLFNQGLPMPDSLPLNTNDIHLVPVRMGARIVHLSLENLEQYFRRDTSGGSPGSSRSSSPGSSDHTNDG